MEAKDTVMTDEQTRQYESYACFCNHTDCRQAQAEVSFKAGYKQRELDPLDKEDRCEMCYEQGKKAGIREVVEWIEKTSGHFTAFNPEDLLPHHCSTCDNSIVGVTEHQWQAKLKEVVL